MNESKTFLFAGASSLIATETATLLKNKGHHIIGVSTKSINSVYDTFHQLEKYDFNAFPSIPDTLDGLVYFPGTINLKPFSRLSSEDFKRDIEINALGAAACIQAYLDNLKKSSQASVVLISTVAVSVGLPFHASVAMAKGAIEGLTKALSAELAPGIRVNCVAPSLVETPLAGKFVDTAEKMEQMKKRNPLRKVGAPMDVANAISFLLTAESSWVTGQVIGVDGGMNAIRN